MAVILTANPVASVTGRGRRAKDDLPRTGSTERLAPRGVDSHASAETGRRSRLRSGEVDRAGRAHHQAVDRERPQRPGLEPPEKEADREIGRHACGDAPDEDLTA